MNTNICKHISVLFLIFCVMETYPSDYQNIPHAVVAVHSANSVISTQMFKFLEELNL